MVGIYRSGLRGPGGYKGGTNETVRAPGYPSSATSIHITHYVVHSEIRVVTCTLQICGYKELIFIIRSDIT